MAKPFLWFIADKWELKVNYHLLKKVALCEPPKRGPLFSPAPIAAALLALDVLRIGVLFLH